jgi:cytochrome c oxidase cbb3-type subunit 3
MIFSKNNTNKIFLVCALIAVSILPAIAQQTPVAAIEPASSSSSTDILWWIIISMAAVLLTGILILSRVLINLVKLAVEKGKAAKVASVIILLLLSSAIYAQTAVTQPVVEAGPTSWNWNLILAGSVLTIEVVVIVILLARIQSLLNELSGKQVEPKPFIIHMPKLFEKLNASVAIEHETDILLDHNYDGIRELDNNLPPWWKYGFYLTIVYAFAYLIYFHIAGGPTSHDEYAVEMEQAKIEKDAYMAKNALNVDENSVKIADAPGITEGQIIFASNCAPCHGAKGEGVVGPNLTDDYWLHGGSLPDVFKSVKYGWPAKGMKSWQTDLSPIQIKNVVSYIKMLHGTTPPNAKAPQGDAYVEAGEPSKTKSDSASVAAK